MKIKALPELIFLEAFSDLRILWNILSYFISRIALKRNEIGVTFFVRRSWYAIASSWRILLSVGTHRTT